MVRLPPCAKVTARLANVVDLPSSATVEVMRSIKDWKSAFTGWGAVEAANEAQAREQYFLFRSNVEQALTSLYANEANLRYIMGLAATDGRLIRPADEPTSGVDPISRRNFWELIYHLAGEGVTVFVTTHYMDEAEYCNRLSIMHQGRIIELGNPTALKQKYGAATLQDLFIGLVKA